MKQILIFMACVFFILDIAQAANPAIIYGPNGYALNLQPNGIQQSSGVLIKDLAVDPTAIATDAPQGSFGTFATRMYVKQDAGATTNWDAISYISDGLGIPVMSKGSIITSDGVSNGELTACADGEIIEWDSVETSGIKCVIKPSVAISAVNLVVSPSSGPGVGGTVTLTAASITTTGNPVRLSLIAALDATGGANFAGMGNGAVTFKRGGSTIAAYVVGNNILREFIETPAAGTYTYSVDVFQPQYLRLVVQEIK